MDAVRNDGVINASWEGGGGCSPNNEGVQAREMAALPNEFITAEEKPYSAIHHVKLPKFT